MKLEFDPGTPALYVTFLNEGPPLSIEEKAEVILGRLGELLAVRIWLGNLLDELQEHLTEEHPEAQLEPLTEIVSACIADGWAFREGVGGPSLFYQFLPANGKIEVIDWAANVEVAPGLRKIVGIEFLFMDFPRPIRMGPETEVIADRT